MVVNHVWLRHFGQPLVPNVFEFGRKGGPPTHPELLEWLASELIANGWRLKPIHKLIMQSAVYVREISHDAVKRHRGGALGQRGRDAFRDIETGGALGILPTCAVGKGQCDHSMLLMLTRCLRMQVSVAPVKSWKSKLQPDTLPAQPGGGSTWSPLFWRWLSYRSLQRGPVRPSRKVHRRAPPVS